MPVQSLKGQLLIAGPTLVDPNFRRTVVLVGEHSEEGALGVVLNRASEATVDEAVPGAHGSGGDRRARCTSAAPYSRRRSSSSQTSSIRSGQARSSSSRSGSFPPRSNPDELGELRRARVFAGYAGWGPGQLDGELEEGSWIVEPAQPDDVFTEDPEQLWAEVLRRKGGPYGVLALMPLDPSLN